jgi:hypothetical protein
VKKIEKLILEYERKIEDVCRSISRQSSIVKAELKRCREGNLMPTFDPGYIWEFKTKREYENKLLILIQIRKDLESLQN